MLDTKEVYRQSEFSRWVQRTGLDNEERFLIGKYLDPTKLTLEAGSGGGRNLLAMQATGFEHLSGFDILPEFVLAARERDDSGTIDYRVQDGRALAYADNSFDQLVYLQQFFSVVGSDGDRQKAIAEAFRVLRPGGRILISLLCMRGRKWRYWPLLAWLQLLRTVSLRPLSNQHQPWLRLDNAPHFKALIDRGPYVYWYHEQEAVALFRDAGFLVEALGSEAQIDARHLTSPPSVPSHEPFRGVLYIVCRKPPCVA